jgi:hypothetical protein
MVLTAMMFFAQPMSSQAAFVYTMNFAPEAVGATGTGSGTVVFDDVANTMQIDLSFSGLSGVTTVSHIHAPTLVASTGTAGVATGVPTFAGFPVGVSAGAYSNTFNMTLLENFNPAFIAANGGTPAGAFSALLTASAEGKAYLNIHSSTFGGGEIRSFLTAVPEPSGAMLIGIASLSIVLRRRRQASA